MSHKISNSRKKLPGYEYRKRKSVKDQKFEKIKKFMSIEKYVAYKKPDEGREDFNPDASTISTTMSNKIGEPSTILKNSCITSLQIEVDNEPVILKESNDLSEDFLQETPNLLDCGNWPIVRSSNFVDHLIKLGPFQITKEKYPEDKNSRHFSSIYYNRKLSNGETFCRRCQTYSLMVSRNGDI
ncbi:zinc finger MYM-type protein 5-like [Hydra vulgaris]|uniref:zinc finger MYM-type protein 5-like n=1 Tax=Hydra vulgaris TaxID=6087 RepID=UPI0032EA7827